MPVERPQVILQEQKNTYGSSGLSMNTRRILAKVCDQDTIKGTII